MITAIPWYSLWYYKLLICFLYHLSIISHAFLDWCHFIERTIVVNASWCFPSRSLKLSCLLINYRVILFLNFIDMTLVLSKPWMLKCLVNCYTFLRFLNQHFVYEIFAVITDFFPRLSVKIRISFLNQLKCLLPITAMKR